MTGWRHTRLLAGAGIAIALLLSAGCDDDQPMRGLGELPAVEQDDWRSASSSTVAMSADGGSLFVANTDSGSVTALDVNERRVAWERSVGGRPATVSVDPRGERLYVTTNRPSALVVLHSTSGELLATMSLSSSPSGVVSSPDGKRVYVAESGVDTIAVIDADRLTRIATIGVSNEPRGLAVTSDGSRLLITHFLSGDVTIVDTELEHLLAIVGTGPESSAASFVAIHPAGTSAYIPHQRSRVSNDNLTFDTTIAPRVSVVDIAAQRTVPRRLLGLDAVDRPVNLPSSLDFSPNGMRLYVANAGSNDISVIDLDTGFGLDHIEVGDNPTGIQISPDGDRAFVLNALDDSVSIVDLVDGRELERIAVTTSPLPPDVHRGQVLFNTANRPELARDQWISCGSCHLDGGTDGRTWLLDDGPRNTPPIRGLRDTAPYHWSGDRVDLFDFQRTIMELQGGTGLSDEELADLEAFLGFHPVDPVPTQAADSSQIGLGRAIFAAAGCAECHSGPALTDQRLHDVGTGEGPFERRGSSFDTPSLLGLRATAPYLHDGQAATLSDVILEHNPADLHGQASDLSAAEIVALEAYLLSLPASD